MKKPESLPPGSLERMVRRLLQPPDLTLYIVKAGLHPTLLLMKRRNLALKVRILRLQLVNLLMKCRILRLKFLNGCLQLRYRWGLFVHNVMLGYACDDRKPSNDPSSATPPETPGGAQSKPRKDQES